VINIPDWDTIPRGGISESKPVITYKASDTYHQIVFQKVCTNLHVALNVCKQQLLEIVTTDFCYRDNSQGIKLLTERALFERVNLKFMKLRFLGPDPLKFTNFVLKSFLLHRKMRTSSYYTRTQFTNYKIKKNYYYYVNCNFLAKPFMPPFIKDQHPVTLIEWPIV